MTENVHDSFDSHGLVRTWSHMFMRKSLSQNVTRSTNSTIFPSVCELLGLGSSNNTVLPACHLVSGTCLQDKGSIVNTIWAFIGVKQMTSWVIHTGRAFIVPVPLGHFREYFS